MMLPTKIALSLVLAATSAHHAGAWEVNIEVDGKTNTAYDNCQGYADNIVALVTLFIKATSDAEKSKVDGEIAFMKKALKKCERRNKKRKPDNKVKVGVSHDFSSKN